MSRFKRRRPPCSRCEGRTRPRTLQRPALNPKKGRLQIKLMFRRDPLPTPLGQGGNGPPRTSQRFLGPEAGGWKAAKLHPDLKPKPALPVYVFFLRFYCAISIIRYLPPGAKNASRWGTLSGSRDAPPPRTLRRGCSARATAKRPSCVSWGMY